MRGWCGRTRAISRKTVSPPTPLSKTPIALFGCAVSRRNSRSPFALDSVLLDLLVQIRSRRVDGLGGLGNVPSVLAEFREDERLLRFIFELLQRRQRHRAADDVGRRAEKLRRKIG